LLRPFERSAQIIALGLCLLGALDELVDLLVDLTN
jgi:hypothetical protein